MSQAADMSLFIEEALGLLDKLLVSTAVHSSGVLMPRQSTLGSASLHHSSK